MKTLVGIALFALGALVACSGAHTPLVAGGPHVEGPASSRVVVRATAMRSDSGVLRCSLFAGSQGWPEHTEVAWGRVQSSIAAHTGECVFERVPAGDYAAVITHDENGNAHFERGPFGIPLEGYGFSNNAHPTTAAPSYEQCHFRHDEGAQTIEIHMLY